MMNKSLESFLAFLAEDKGHQAKAKSFAEDMDALAAYARGLGYNVSPEELRQYRDKARRLVEERIKRQERQGLSPTPGARAFYALLELAETDSEVANRLEELGGGSRQELIAYGREKGFVFDEQDLDTVGKDILQPTDELSEEELEMVAGGASVIIFLGLIAFGGAVILAAAAFVAGVIVQFFKD